MAVRPRRQRRGPQWTPAIALALQIGPAPQPAGATLRPSDAVLEAAWEAYGPYLLSLADDPSEVWGFRRFATAEGAERPCLTSAPPLPPFTSPRLHRPEGARCPSN